MRDDEYRVVTVVAVRLERSRLLLPLKFEALLCLRRRPRDKRDPEEVPPSLLLDDFERDRERLLLLEPDLDFDSSLLV